MTKLRAMFAATAATLLLSSCTLYHSRQAMLSGVDRTPSSSASFVTEEDSGLMLFSVLVITEPDHYAILMERARKRYQCDRLHHAQLDFYTDYWTIVAFPIARLTLVCEKLPKSARETEKQPADEPAPSATPSKPPPPTPAATSTETETQAPNPEPEPAAPPTPTQP